MRNKKTVRYGLLVALLVPFLALSVAMAEHGEDSGMMDHDETTQAEKTAEQQAEKLRQQKAEEQRRMNKAAEDKKAREAALRKAAEDKQAKEESRSEAAKEMEFKRCLGQPGTRCGLSDEDRAKLQEKRDERLDKARGIVMAQIMRAQHVLERLDQIMLRIQSRRDKLVAAGANVTAVDRAIAEVAKQKGEVQAALAKAKSDAEAIKDAEDPKAALEAFRASMKTLKGELEDLHDALKAVIKEMRKAMPKPTDAKDDAGDSAESN
jgi:hypothetical protein